MTIGYARGNKSLQVVHVHLTDIRMSTAATVYQCSPYTCSVWATLTINFDLLAFGE